MKPVALLVLMLVACGEAAAAPLFHVHLPSVEFTRKAGQTQLVTGTIRNDGVDSLFLQGVLTDVPTSMGGDTASAGFLATAPAALGPGEAWTGEILTLHLAPNVTLGNYVFSVAALGAASVFDAPAIAGTYIQVNVVDSIPVLAVGSQLVLVERLFTSPNPFRGQTGVQLDLRAAHSVDVCVFDVTGRLVRRLYRGQAEAGRHAYVWDGTDAVGRPAGPGVYLVQAKAGSARFLSRTVKLN